MDLKRQQEIAHKILLNSLAKSGINPNLSREMGNQAKELEIEPEEMRQFIEAILPHILRKILGRKSVQLITS